METQNAVRAVIFLIGVAGMFASMVFTCASMLSGASPPDFSAGWYFASGSTWLFLAKFVSGVCISATQATSLIIYKTTGQRGAFRIFVLATSISCLITVVAFHTGLEQGVLDALNSSDELNGLRADRDRLIIELRDLADMRKKRFNDGYQSKSAEEYSAEIRTKEYDLAEIREQIRKFDKTGRADKTAVKNSYSNIAADIMLLMPLSDGIRRYLDDRLALLMMYFVMIGVSVLLDLGATSAIAFAVCGGLEDIAWGDRDDSVASSNAPSQQAGIMKKLSQMTIDEIESALPQCKSIVKAIPTLETRILICGGSGSGKTTLLTEMLNKRAPAGSEIIVIDPKVQKAGKWPDRAKIIGSGENYDQIISTLETLKRQCAARSNTQNENKPVFIIIDEMYAIGKYCKEHDIDFGPLWTWILTFARENKMYLVALTQSDRAGSLGTKGEHDLVESFNLVLNIKFHPVKNLRWAELKMSGFPPELFSIPNLSKNSLSAKSRTIFESVTQAVTQAAGGSLTGSLRGVTRSLGHSPSDTKVTAQKNDHDNSAVTKITPVKTDICKGIDQISDGWHSHSDALTHSHSDALTHAPENDVYGQCVTTQVTSDDAREQRIIDAYYMSESRTPTGIATIVYGQSRNGSHVEFVRSILRKFGLQK